MTALPVLKTIKLFIGGDFPRSESGRSYTLEGYANLPRASRKDFRNAVTAAQGALGSWAARSAYNRGQILYRMAEMCEGKRAEFHEALTRGLGLDETPANNAVDEAIEAFIYYAGFADKYQQLTGTVNPVSGPHHSFTSAEPVGVVGVLLSEATPLGLIASRIAATICSGNTVVALLPEKTGALLAPLAEVFATSDLPKGVVNLLAGHVDELASQFGSHMELQAVHVEDKARAAEIKELGADNLKRVTGADPERLGLENILNHVEHKTVWHPAGY